MKTKGYLLAGLIIALLFMCTSGAASSYAADYSQCRNCHPQIDFAAGQINRLTTCYSCHINALHAPNNITYTPYGYYDASNFTNPSLSQDQVINGLSASFIHSKHGGSAQTAAGCIGCHGKVSCKVCHTSVGDPTLQKHEPHSATLNPPLSLNMALGPGYGDRFPIIQISCVTSNCHKIYPDVTKTRSDGSQLCLNCHATDGRGHYDATLLNTKHSSSASTIKLGSVDYVVSCASCHAQTLNGEHNNVAVRLNLPQNGGCYYCHGQTAQATVVNTVYQIKTNNKSTTDLAVKANNRSCTVCHFNISVLPGNPAEHVTYHLSGLSDKFVDIAKNIHQACNTCHDRATPLSVSVSVYGVVYQKTLAQLASMVPKNYSCLDCHNGNSNPKAPVHKAQYNGQATGLLDFHTDCSFCHTPGSQYAAKVDTIVATLKANPAYNYSCTDCHANLTNSHNAYYQFGTETINFNTTKYHRSCFACHSNSKVSGVIKLLKGSTTAYNCNQCHNGTAAKLAIHTTASSEAIVGYHPGDAVSSRCDKCHGEANFAKINIPGWPVNYQCTNCHNGVIAANGFHQAKADINANPEVISTTYHKACTTCHGNFLVQPVINSLKGKVTAPYLCSECHNTTLNLAPNHKAKMTVSDTVYSTITDYHLDATGKTACGMCHGSAKLPTGTIATLKAAPSYLCDDCHKPGTVIAYSHNANFGTEAINQKTTDYHQKCQTCHDNAQAKPNIKGLIGQTVYDCAQCHNGTVTYKALHQAKMDTVSNAVYTVGYHPNCVTCHKSTNTNVINFITTNKGAITSYMCSDCHGDLVAKHQSTSDLTSTMNMVNCSWCHTSKEAAYATNNLIGVHIKPNITLSKLYDCNVCHGAASPVKTQVTNKQTACDACHNGTSAPVRHPDTQYYPKHVVSPFPTFMPEYSPNCTTCHTSNSMITLHADPKVNVGCTTCHFTEAYKPAVVTPYVYYPSVTADCNGCHKAGIMPVSSQTTMDMVYSHTKYHNSNTTLYPATVECLNCHAKDNTVDGSSLLAVHKKKATSTVTCDTCHATTARQAVKDAITAKNVSCQACHGDAGHNHPVAATGYMANQPVECGQCHATNTADKGAELTKIHQDAASRGLIPGYGCSTCHNPTFEGVGKVIVKDGTLDMKQNGTTVIYCTDCHNGLLADALGKKYPAHDGNHINSTGYGAYKVTVNGTVYDDSTVDCSKCHASLDTKVVHDPAVHPNLSCNSCHQSTNPEVMTVIAGAWSRSATKAPYTCSNCHNTLPYKHQPEHIATSADYATLDCSGCHSTTSWTGANAIISGVHKNNCNVCHASTISVVNAFVYSKQGQVNPVYSCEGCHTAGGAQTKETVHQPEHKATHSATGMNCSSCHSFNLTAGTAGDISTIHKNGCATCHSATAPDNVKLVIALKKGQINPVYNCEDCHGTIHLGWDAKHKPVFPTVANLNCVDCHDNYLPNEHQKALTPTANTAIAYQVFRSTSSTGPWTLDGSTTATSYADTGLSPNTTYYYKLTAYDGKPNYSGESSIVSVKTLTNIATTSTVTPTVQSSNGNTIINLNYDAKNYTQVKLKMTVWYFTSYESSTYLIINPYLSNGTSINTASAVNGPIRSSSNVYTETIDVTSIAKTMNGFGWMKFNVKPSSGSVSISNVQVILSQTPASGGTAVNPPGTLAATPNDTISPTVPTGLSAIANYYDRVDLIWNASTDTSGVSGDVCAICHASTASQQVKDAITNHNAVCSACHTIHTDASITTAHTGNALPTTPWDCAKCHSNVLSLEHSANATLKQNGLSGLSCATCHKSTSPKVQAAIHSTVTDKSNLVCGACHTGTADGVPAVHTDIASPHLTGIFPTAADSDCLNCHTTQAGEFAATKAAYHAVNGLTSKAAAGWGTYLTPWTSISSVGCQGCHGNNNDGKAQVANILKRTYTYMSNSNQTDMVCYLCHDRNSYGGGSESTGKSGFSNGGKNYHNIGDHKPNGFLQCSWCHSAVPHGTNKAHLIVTKTDANSTGNLLTNYYHPASGQYQKEACGSDASACGDHKGY